MVKRSKWKLPYIHTVFFKKRFLKQSDFCTKIRNSVIPSLFLNKRVKVYNGIWFKSKDITIDTCGYKLGEFSFTKLFDTQLQEKSVSKKKGKKHQNLKKK